MDLRSIRPHWPLFLKMFKESSLLLDSHTKTLTIKQHYLYFSTLKAQKSHWPEGTRVSGSAQSGTQIFLSKVVTKVIMERRKK